MRRTRIGKTDSCSSDMQKSSNIRGSVMGWMGRSSSNDRQKRPSNLGEMQAAQYESARRAAESEDATSRDERFLLHRAIYPGKLEGRYVKSPFFMTIFMASAVLRILQTQIVSENAGAVIKMLAPPNDLTPGMGLFLSFFATSFVAAAMKRYFTFHSTSQAVIGRLFNIAVLSTTWLPGDAAKQMFRYTNVAHMALYMKLIDDNSNIRWWDDVMMPRLRGKNIKLLSPGELMSLQADIEGFGGGCSAAASGTRLVRILIMWCERVVRKATQQHKEGAEPLPQIMAGVFHSELRELRGLAGDMNDFFDRPLPYSYITIAIKLIAAYYALVSLSMLGELEEAAPSIVWQIVSVAILGFQFCAMLNVARAMESPFGFEADDLPVLDYIDFALMETKILYDWKEEFVSEGAEELSSMFSGETEMLLPVEEVEGGSEETKELSAKIKTQLATPAPESAAHPTLLEQRGRMSDQWETFSMRA
eukprot:TRINITY_DN2228_c0_g1_i1.p1 TRINITY_DN2228_c0_g1~~TRINITY_DN2228_c0_g1_i1.p1  ORF type:complete len:476 (+),score=83.63 TRINITY_DN2228_c0_g1_i1:78-1505(+)